MTFVLTCSGLCSPSVVIVIHILFSTMLTDKETYCRARMADIARSRLLKDFHKMQVSKGYYLSEIIIGLEQAFTSTRGRLAKLLNLSELIISIEQAWTSTRGRLAKGHNLSEIIISIEQAWQPLQELPQVAG
jgi:hypothetical protein